MKKIKVLLVGAGGWAKSWFRFIHESPDFELIGVVSRGGPHLDQARREWGIPAERCYNDLAAAQGAGAQVALVSVPHSLHVEMSRQALDAGLDVLCEKPLADDYVAACGLVARARRLGRRFGVSQNFRYREAVHRLRAFTTLGKLESLAVSLYQRQGRMADWRRGQVSPLLLEIMIHHVDIMRFLSGAEARLVSCTAWNPPWSTSQGEASAHVHVEFDSGAHLDFNGSWAATGALTTWEGDWRMQYKQGAVRWDGKTLHAEDFEMRPVDLPVVSNFPGPDRQGLLVDFAAWLRGEPSGFTSTGEDNLKSLAIVFAALLSNREHRPVAPAELIREA